MTLFPPHYIDFYKSGHIYQMPDKVERQFNNYTSRSSRLPGVNHMVFFGLQYFITEYLIRQWNLNFFQLDKTVVVKKYKDRMNKALGEGSVGIEHIEDLHDYGRLPITILALPEGSIVPTKVPCLVYFNSDPRFAWLVGYLETILSTTLWGACNSATIAYEYRKLMIRWAKETGGDLSFVPFQGHDFSMRGMFGLEAACISGAAHLLSFMGTDTVPALDFIEEYYEPGELFLGGSVPATEHSVMCMGSKEGEYETIKRLITETYPSGVISVVSDTWDLWHVIQSTLPKLKDEILNRHGTLVIRPDSGDPVDILCGTWTPVDHPGAKTEAHHKGVIELLWDIFGGTINDKGYKQLDSHIGAIYGDSITPDRADRIFRRLEEKGFASTNVVLGIGSYTYQYNTRDTLGQAIKATHGVIDSVPRDLFKDPLTDKGDKKSAKGLLAVFEENGSYVLKEQATWDEVTNCALNPVFIDGHFVAPESFGKIRNRLLGML